MSDHRSTDLLTREEAAAMARVSLRTLQNLDRANAGPPRVQLSARRVAYRRAQVEAWIASREVPTAVAA